MLPGYEAESIHRFRISYKKLSAFLRMLSTPRQEHKLNVLKPLKRYYRLCGRVRELQIQQTLFIPSSEKGPEQEYVGLLQGKIERLQELLSKMLPERLAARSRSQNLRALNGNFRMKKYKKFLRNRTGKIDKIIAEGVFSDTNLHTVRKALKELLYTGIYFKGKTQEQRDNWTFKLDRAAIKELSEKLGHFQDQCTSLRLLRTGSDTTLSPECKMWLRKERKIYLASKAAMKKLLVKELKSTFTTYASRIIFY